MKLVEDLTWLNFLNDEDRTMRYVKIWSSLVCIRFAGKYSKGCWEDEYKKQEASLLKKYSTRRAMSKMMALITDEDEKECYDTTREFYKIFGDIKCGAILIESKMLDEEKKDFPIPNVSDLLYSEIEFVSKLFWEMIWRSEDKIYFNDMCERIVELDDLETKLWWTLCRRNDMNGYKEAVEETLQLLEETSLKFDDEERNRYQDDEKDQEIIV